MDILTEDLVAECGAAGDAGVGGVVSGQEWNFAAAGIDAPSRDAFANVREERLHDGGDAATDDDHIGLQQIDNISKPCR